MLRYLAKRLVYAILVLLAVSMITFFMSTIAPGDLVNAHLSLEGGQTAYKQHTFSVRSAAYMRSAERLGTHLPLFYFTVHPIYFPDTLHRIVRKEERQVIKQLLLRNGNWQQVEAYRKNVHGLLLQLQSPQYEAMALWPAQASNDAEFLLTTSDTGRISYLMNSISHTIPTDKTDLQAIVQKLTSSYERIQNTKTNVWKLIPTIAWHGKENRYHQWIKKTIGGDLGLSLIDGRPVKTKIHEALRWTLNINVVAIILAFGIAIPLGVATARRAGRWSDRVISSVLFAFYAIPSFWLAMLCIVFLTTSEYGSWLDLFPTSGVGMVTDGMSFWERLNIRISHLLLPVFCVTVGSLAYLTRQMRGSMLRELRQDYIRMARAKGLSERVIHWRHAFRNALFPMITMVGSAFPAAISGTVILEVIFSIPGMGRLLYMSILSQDWPVVYAMVLLASCLTIGGYLITDLLYRWADPRVSLHMNKA